MTDRCRQLRRDTFNLMIEHHARHFGGTMSCIEILAALYDKVLKADDVFILSKGHAAFALYTLLHERGLKPIMDEMTTFDPANGVHATTGSLGHGLPMAIGIAWAKQLQAKPGRVYCLLGDAECQEGTFWESLLQASTRKLGNLYVIVDANNIQGSNYVNRIVDMPWVGMIADQCQWRSFTVMGHEVDFLATVLDRRNDAMPTLLTAQTIKGKGVSFMENDPKWHSRDITAQEIEQARKELA